MMCYEFWSFRDDGILQDPLGPTSASGNSNTPMSQRYFNILKVEAKSVFETLMYSNYVMRLSAWEDFTVYNVLVHIRSSLFFINFDAQSKSFSTRPLSSHFNRRTLIMLHKRTITNVSMHLLKSQLQHSTRTFFPHLQLHSKPLLA